MIDEQTILSCLGDGTRSYACSCGRQGYYRTVANFRAADALEERLAAEGFSLCSDRTMGSLSARLWRHGRETVSVARQPGIAALRVIVARDEDLFTGVNGPERQTPGMVLANMDYSIQTAKDNGMGFVVTLADGRFLIYDGGYGTETDPLMAYLSAHSPKGQKPVVAAWVLTHSHADHYLCVKDFLNRCPERATVERFLLCAPPPVNAKGDRWADCFLSEQFPALAAQHGIPCYAPYAGQLLRFPGVQMEILQTADDLHGVVTTNVNEASMTTRLVFPSVEGKSVLIPGDLTGTHSLNRLVHNCGAYLKSDVLQIPHHGHSGGTKEFYDAVDPETVVFCTAEDKYRERIEQNGAWNFYLLNWLHVRKTIVADHGYQTVL